MTIIDKIMAEFQKRFEICQSVSEDDQNALDVQDYYRGKYTAYSEAISFISMLLQEQEKKHDSEDLEEAAKKYDEAESWRYEALKYPRREAFEAGAEWQKRQIIKDTIDIKVIESYNPTCEPNERLHGISFIYDCKNDNQYLIAGDRAKVIIVKEDEK